MLARSSERDWPARRNETKRRECSAYVCAGRRHARWPDADNREEGARAPRREMNHTWRIRRTAKGSADSGRRYGRQHDRRHRAARRIVRPPSSRPAHCGTGPRHARHAEAAASAEAGVQPPPSARYSAIAFASLSCLSRISSCPDSYVLRCASSSSRYVATPPA